MKQIKINIKLIPISAVSVGVVENNSFSQLHRSIKWIDNNNLRIIYYSILFYCL